jgi:hypothetical protein
MKRLLASFLLPTLLGAVSLIEPAPHITERNWDADWIAPASEPAREYGVYHFRKHFELSEAPDKFVIHISADNEYRLFINGVPVHSGPERGDLRHWRFDSLDVADYLKAGENLLAAQVWNFGVEAPVAQITEQTAFVIQGDGELESVINTNGSWQAMVNEAYSPITDFDKKLRTYIVVGPGDHVDGALYPWSWETLGADGSDWAGVKVIRSARPRGNSSDGKWLLVPREVPLMETAQLRLKRIRKTENVSASPDFLNGNAPIQIAPNTKSILLFDQNELTTAYPELRVSGGNGSQIKLTYAESLYEGSLEEMSRVKGHRDEIEGKHIRGFEDVFVLDGGKDRLYRPLRWRTYRYIQLEIETANEPLEVVDFYGIFTAYPFSEHASFRSSDPVLERIWEISWRTIRLGAHDLYMDTPYYEQLSYVGDTRIEALVSLYVSGDARLMKKSIRSFDNSRNANGLTGSRYPDSRHQLIPPFSLVWISMVHDYWRLVDDREFVEESLDGVREVLRYFKNHSDPETGSYTGRQWWNYVDWKPEWGRDPVANHSGVPPRDADGVSSILNLMYVYTLQHARDLYADFGYIEEAAKCDELANRIRRFTLESCWDETRGLIADTSEKESFSQHANSYFILTAEENAPELLSVARRMLEGADLAQATLYFSFYTHKALISAGLGNEYLDQLGMWEELLDQGLTSLPETPTPTTRSDSHAWGAHPILNMLATICGIEPGEPGFKSVRVAPQLGELEYAQGVVPHPKGLISVDLRRNGEEGVEGSVTLPRTLTGVFEWKGQTQRLHSGLNPIVY